jgi:cell division protein FtsQ
MVRWTKERIIRFTTAVLAGGALLLLFAFVNSKHSARVCEQIIIRIEGKTGNHFIAEADVLEMLTMDGSDNPRGKMRVELDLRKYENRLKKNPFIQEAQVATDLEGNMQVMVQQPNPVARWIHPSGAQGYLSDNGERLPLSKHYTARVPVLRGVVRFNANGFLSDNDSLSMHLLHMLIFIKNNTFWNAQIAELEITNSYDLILYPQVTRQIIQFGTPDGYEEKLGRLMLFYKQILPVKGWNTYQSVSVKFKNQIICN